MNLRILNEADAQIFRELRLSSLKTDPEAFGSTYDREATFAIEYFVDRLAVTENKFVLGRCIYGRKRISRHSSFRTRRRNENQS